MTTGLITRKRRRTVARVEIVPMIDVMFFLVVFFMLFSTFKTTHEGIAVDLPRAAAAQEQPVSELVVSITKDGAYYVNERLTTVDGLKESVRQALVQDDAVVAVIRGDREVQLQYVITAIDAMTEAGGSALSFTVEKPPVL